MISPVSYTHLDVYKRQVEDELEYPDEMTDEEIEDDIKEIVMQRVDWYWEPVN